MSNALLPERALVIGVDTPIGLAIIRELGSQGVEVYGVARSPRGVGLFSKWLTKGYLLSGERSVQLAGILNIIDEHKIGVLMAISEGDLLWLNQHREAFSGVKLLFPDEQQIRTVLDKAQVYAVAQKAGVPLPRMFTPESPQDARTTNLRFPVVVKWADPNAVVPLLEKAGLPLEKFLYAYDQNELYAQLKRFEPVGCYPVVQEFCRGYGLGQMFLMHQGEAALYFQHRRIHEWPPEGGVSTLCEALDPGLHTDLREKSLALLKALNWDGVAMVEYRHDPLTGQSALMEINGRFWGSLPLAHHAHAPFAWELFRLKALGEKPDASNIYRSGIYRTKFRCAYIIPELKRLFVILFAAHRIQNRSLHFSPFNEILSLLKTWLNPRTRYYVFSLRDPKPFFYDITYAIRNKILHRH